MTDQLIDVHAAFAGFRNLLRSCGPCASKHDRAVVLITACIEAGFKTRTRIVGVARTLGFPPAQTGKVLAEGMGTRWTRDHVGTFRVLE